MMGLEYIFDVTLQHYLLLGMLLFSIGLLVIMVKRNLLIILMGVELMLNGVNVIAVSFGHYTNNVEGQILAFFILTVAAAEAGVGLVIAISIFKEFKSTHISNLTKLKG